LVKNIYRLVFKRRHMSQDISEDEAGKLLENRTEFKLYAAQQHLNNLKMLEQKGSNMRLSKERVRWEMEIESLLFHLVGVGDTLLAKTNDKLDLKLKGRDICLRNIKLMLNFLNEKNLLSKKSKENILANLNKFDDLNWFTDLRHWRNQVTHITLLNVLFTVGGGEPKVFFRADPDKKLEVIPYLEDSLHKVKVLLQEIIGNEPLLG
jgi:hypothetical protein